MNDEQRPRLRVKPDTFSLTDRGKSCPACGTILASDALLCTACGYDFRTGKRPSRIDKGRVARRVGWLLAALVVVAGVWAVVTLWRDAQPHLNRFVREDLLPGWEEGWSTPEREAREHLEAMLNARLPVLAKGEKVEVRRANGVVARGHFLGVEQGNLLLEGDQQQPLEIPLKEVDLPTRLRASESVRTAYLDSLVGEFEQRRAAETDLGGNVEDVLKRSLNAAMTALGLQAVSGGTPLPALPKELELRSRLAEDLDRRIPMYREGERVELRTAGGVVQRGTLVKTDQTTALLRGDDQREATLELKQLDKASRLRLDAAYRTAFIEAAARRYLQAEADK